jgi:hypothetical protein
MADKQYENTNEYSDSKDYQANDYFVEAKNEQEEYSKKITKLALLERKLNTLNEGEWGPEDEEPPTIYIDIVG